MFQTPLAVPAAVGGITSGPGAFDPRAARVGGAGRGAHAWAAMVARGVCCGREAARPQPRAGLLEPRAVPQVGHAGNRAGALDAAERVARVNDGTKAPGVPLVVACVRQPSKPCAGRRHRPHICVEDDVLSGRGTDHLPAPAPVGWAPGGAAGRAEIVTEQKGVEARRGRLEIAPGLVTGSTEIPDGFVRDLRAIDRRESARAPQAGPVAGVTTGGVDPIARLLRAERWGNDPAAVAFLRAIAVEPRPTWTRFLDQDQLMALGVPRADAHVDVALTSAKGAKVDDFSLVCCGNIGDSHRLLMNIHADVEHARLVHG